MKAIVGVAWDDPAKRYGTALTATFVKGKQATATSRESYNNTGSAIADSSTEYMRVPGWHAGLDRLLAVGEERSSQRRGLQHYRP